MKRLILLSAAAVILLTGCGYDDNGTDAATAPETVTAETSCDNVTAETETAAEDTPSDLTQFTCTAAGQQLSFMIPSGWTVTEEEKLSEDEYLRIRIGADSAGYIMISCDERMGICGTGVSPRKTVIGGREAIAYVTGDFGGPRHFKKVPGAGFYLLQNILIASAAKDAVPLPPTLSIFSVNSPPAEYICPRPRRISLVQL